jgi:putative glutamine amidotransferase
MGGSLYQDLKAEKSAPLVPHNVTDIKYRHYRHAVQMKEGSRLAAAVGAGRICVNSHHHQAIKRLGSGLEVAGKTEDGVVEAVEARGEAIFGVQWHPELLGLEGQALFRWFYEICQKG